MKIDMINMLHLAISSIIGLIVYFIILFIQKRLFYRNLPCPPHSMLWGHLKLVNEYMQKLPAQAYIHTVLTQIKYDYDLPDIYYLDLWPAGPRFAVCTSPDSCAISTTVNNYEMPEQVAKFFEGTIGTGFIEGTNGDLWRNLHQMLAPGLTPSAVKANYNLVVDEAAALHHRLQGFAKNGDIIDLQTELGRYPFQVIAGVIFGEALSPQLYEEAKRNVDLQTSINATQNPIVKYQLRNAAKKSWKRIETVASAKIIARFAALKQLGDLPAKSNLSTLLDRMLSSREESRKSLDKGFLRLILDNINGLLVAGYGTTTDTSCYLLLLLGSYPQALEKLREEHDRIFDHDFDLTLKKLKENPNLLNQLEYTTAVINETLRLFPLAFSVRKPPPNMTDFAYNGRNYPIKDHVFGISSHSMHYSPQYFNNPKEFIPERFLTDPPTFPRNAFRPFERGVRSCLGTSLAMAEMKIMLLLVARWFNFEFMDAKATRPRFSFTDLDTKIGQHAFQAWSYTAGPSGPVRMKVTLAE